MVIKIIIKILTIKKLNDKVYLCMWLKRIKEFFKKGKVMKKSKEKQVNDSVPEVKQNEPAKEVLLNNKAFGLIVSNGQYKIIEIPFNSESFSLGELSVTQSCQSRDEAQERFRILVARTVFTQGAR